MPFLKQYKICPDWKRKEQTSYKTGCRHTVYFLNGDQHTGEWKNNLKEGKGAELSRSGLYLYEGDFANMHRHGHGVLSKRQPDGTFQLVYNGMWARGKRHGYGIQRGSCGSGSSGGAEGSWYDGCWRHGARCGQGRAWLPDGSFYQGQWLDNKLHGQGLLLMPNGNRYEGEFYAGLRHGKGTLFHLERGLVQEGVWERDICVASTLQAPGPQEEEEGSRAPSQRPSFPPIELLHADDVVAESQREALQRSLLG